MGDLVVVGLQELRTVFSTHQQFIGPLCNVFKTYNVRRSLWNGTLIGQSVGHVIFTFFLKVI